MRKAILLGAVLLSLVTLVGSAQPPIGPVRLKVDKTDKKARKTTHQDSSGNYRHEQVEETVYYTIEVANISAGNIPSLRIHWAVLVDSSRAVSHGAGISSQGKVDFDVVEGERTCSLNAGRKFVFDTDPIDLSVVIQSYANTTAKNHYGGQVLGYCVEVFQDAQLIASETIPADTKRRIEQLKERKSKSQQAR